MEKSLNTKLKVVNIHFLPQLLGSGNRQHTDYHGTPFPFIFLIQIRAGFQREALR